MDTNRIFGGNPLGVIVRLVVLSVIVGIVMSALGIHPRNILDHLQLLVRRIYDLGFGTIEGAIGFFLIGAVVVVPIWAITRLLSGLKNRDGDRR